MSVDHNLLDALCYQMPDNTSDRRFTRHLHQRLGALVCQPFQPRSQAGSQNDRPFNLLHFNPPSSSELFDQFRHLLHCRLPALLDLLLDIGEIVPLSKSNQRLDNDICKPLVGLPQI